MKTRIGFAVLLLLALAVALAVSLTDALSALSSPAMASGFATSGLGWALAGAIVLQLVGHLVRSEKHSLILREIRPIGRRQVFRGQMIGFMFNALLPFRIGELMRAHYVGRSVQISRAAVFATIVFERCVDLLVVCGIGVGVVLVDGSAWGSGFATIVLSATTLLVFTVAALFVCSQQPRWLLVTVFRVTGLLNEELRDRSRHIVWSFCHALRYAIPHRALLVRYFALSAVMWAGYVGSVVVLAAALRGWSGPASQFLGLADAPYIGVTTWRGMGVLEVFTDRTAVLANPWLPAGNVIPFAFLVWAVLVAPSVVLGAIALLHRDLVEHVQGRGEGSSRANKLFRDRDTSSGFAHLLGAHFRGEHLGRVVSREEALGSFTVVKALKGGSHASTLLVWQNDALVVKKITLPEHASKLQSQHDWLRARTDARQLVDAVGLQSGLDFFSIDIEFRDGHVSFFEHLHATSMGAAWSVLERILDFTAEAIYRPQEVEAQRSTLDRYIRTKAVGKIEETAAASPTVAALLQYDSIMVNGERFANFRLVLEAILADEQAMKDLCEFTDGPIHGDLTIDNMMVDPGRNEFMIIDPNDENAISDPIVDHAKLLQSLHSGYEFLLLHDHAAVSADRVTFEERKSAHYQYLYNRLHERLQGALSPARFRALLFHEALHYCRMLPYRAAINPDSVALYYGIAVRLLNEFIAQYDDSEADDERGSAPRESALTHH